MNTTKNRRPVLLLTTAARLLLAVVLLLPFAPAASSEPAESPQRLLEQAQAWKEKGKFARAITAAEEALAVDRRRSATADEQTIEILELLVDLNIGESDFAAAADYSRELVSIYNSRHGDRDWRTRGARVESAYIEQVATFDEAQLDRLGQADAWLEKARQEPPTPFDKKPIRLAEKALEAFDEVLGPKSVLSIDPLSKLAGVYYARGKYKPAEEYALRAAAVAEKHFGKHHPRYAAREYALGRIYNGMDHYDRALEHLREAVRIYGETRGTDTATYRTYLKGLLSPLESEAEDLEDWGRYYLDDNERLDEALKYRREALDLRNRLSGPKHWETADARWALVTTARRRAADRDRRRQLNDAGRTIKQVGQLIADAKYAKALPLAREAADLHRELLGEKHPAYARCLATIGRLQHDLRRDDEAAATLQSAGAILRESLGEEHPQYATHLMYVVSIHSRQGDLDGAIELQRRVVQIVRATLGERDRDYEFALRQLERLLEPAADEAEAVAELDKARRLFVELADVRSRLRSPDHWSTVEASLSVQRVDHLAKFSDEQWNRLVDAIDEIERANALAREHKLHEALAAAEKASAEVGRLMGQTHQDFASTCATVGILCRKLGNFARAEAELLRSQDILLGTVGATHPDHARSLYHLADLYRVKGDFARADPLYERADRICRISLTTSEYDPRFGALMPVFGDDHPERAAVLLDRGRMYFEMGDNVRAEAMLDDARRVLEAALGQQSAVVAGSLMSLGRLRLRMGQPEKAEPLLRRASEMFRKVAGEESAEYAVSLRRLGDLCIRQGKTDKGRPMLEQAAEILEGLLTGAPLRRSTGLHCQLAYTRWSLGQTQQAAEHLRKAVHMHRQLDDVHTPLCAATLGDLAELEAGLGNHTEAERLLLAALETSRRQLEATAAIQSERQQMATVGLYRRQLDAYLSLAARGKASAEAAYRHVLLWKGSVFARQRRLRLLRQRPELAPWFADLEQTAGELATHAWAAGRNKPAARMWIEELTERKEYLEGQIAQRSVAFRELKMLFGRTAGDLTAVLPKGTALVDFLEFADVIPAVGDAANKTGGRRLAAFVLTAGQPPRLIDLGPAEPIDDAVERWRAVFGDGQKGTRAGTDLRRLVWQPLAKGLTGATAVLVSPDGGLCRFPLIALPGEKAGRYLIEELSVTVVPVPQLLPELLAKVPQGAADSILLVGNVDFDADPGQRGEATKAGGKEDVTGANGRAGVADRHEKHEERKEGREVRGSERGASRVDSDEEAAADAGSFTSRTAAPLRPGNLPKLTSLKGFANELQTIGDRYRATHAEGEVFELATAAATEDAFRRHAPGRRYIHLVTHGFFAANALARKADKAIGVEVSASIRHPGVLSGITLAGANRRAEPIGKRAFQLTDDGILTAMEVVQLDLGRTELVVLSACETGLGQPAGGEGLLGLQRAFQVAGARTVVASLWKVDDAATEQLMTDFYRNLWQEKLSPAEALHKAQLRLLRGVEASDEDRGPGSVTGAPTATGQLRAPPRHWAAWIVSGAPGRLTHPTN